MSWESILVNYEHQARLSTDMIEHMPTIKAYASQCETIVEFGVYDCTSTWALLAGRPLRMRSYDVVRQPDVCAVESAVLNSRIDFKFILASSIEVEIEETDLLFIDSFHSYAQLSKELALHAVKVKKFILMHDTTTFAEVDQDYKPPGLWKAVEEFLAVNPQWKIKERFTNCHGLTVLERI